MRHRPLLPGFIQTAENQFTNRLAAPTRKRNMGTVHIVATRTADNPQSPSRSLFVPSMAASFVQWRDSRLAPAVYRSMRLRLCTGERERA